MDKNTLSQYGWVVICIIVLVLLIALATPFGNYVKDSVTATVESFSDKTKLTFENAGLDLPEKTYTAEQISADQRLYGIGATRPEYGIAKFNSSFSDVTIYKNGEGSDGRLGSAYNAFLTKESVLVGLKGLFAAEYDLSVDQVRLEYNTGITDPAQLALTTRAYSTETGEELERRSSIYYADLTKGFDIETFTAHSPKKIRVKEGITNIPNFTFMYCSNAEEIILPTTIESIGNFAFFYCVNIKELTIPENATIANNAFSRCDKLTTVRLVDENGNVVRTLTQEEINAYNPYF